MNTEKQHKNLSQVDAESRAFFSKGEISWEKSKADIWGGLEKKLHEKPSAKVVPLIRRSSVWYVAASIALLISVGGFLAFYSVTKNCPDGQHYTTTLPDGSFVELNAGSFLKYYPNRWLFSREVFFEGEGFFKIVKGKKFEVVSKSAKTVVLGTSFNIYSRDGRYSVTCLTGKVKVVSANNSTVQLSPRGHADVNANGEITVVENYQPDRAISWRNSQFIFTGAPLSEVVSEIGRQYGVSIRLKKNFNLNYTGNFNKETNVEKVLDLVCKPLAISFVKKSDKEYIIIQNN
ncbi:Putative anti-sigma factor [hydrothermal vent metagenome]|uniref:Anti-sigma factor n=1 Tax=hydrothermal vent metagenome TaxID=652676 RepID=A0A3B0U0X4_9ZZZZ